MKSSSALFPVALMRAEVLSSELIEDTYLLKPNNSADPTAQVALSRLGYYENKDKDRGQPVVLIHGAFSNRGIWLDSQLQGMARFLLEHGFDPWMLEFRGHGDSPENQQYEKNTLELYAEYDLPAVEAFVYEQTNKKVLWIGHSSGGLCIATALAARYVNQNTLGAVLFGAQVSRYPLALYIPFAKTIAKFWLLTKSQIHNSKYGPEAEPKGVGLEFLRWASLFARWKSKKGISFKKEAANCTLPILAFGAKKDRSDPAKACEKFISHFGGETQFHLLSKQRGFTQDYNHGSMVKSEAAQKEVWPHILNWFQSISNNTQE